MTRKEQFLDAFALLILRHRVATCLVILLITTLLGFSITRLPLMTTLRDFLPDDAIGLEQWDAARERFGGDQLTVISVEAKDHFTPEGVTRLKSLQGQLESHPYVETVTSIVNIQRTISNPDAPEDLLVTSWFEEERTPSALREALLADDKINGALVSADGNSVLFLVRAVPDNAITAQLPQILEETNRRTSTLPGRETQRQFPEGERRLLEIAKQGLSYELEALAILEGFQKEGIHITGFASIISAMLKAAENNMRTLFPFCGLCLMLAVFLLFRRLVDSVLPFICVLPAIIWAIGLGGLIFGRITIMTSVAPIMVLVVGVSDVVHLVTQFRHELYRGHPREEAIRISFREVGSACLLTSITTLLGFASLLFLPLPGLRELGFFAGIGVVTAFILAFLLTPILLSVAPLPVISSPLEERGTLSLFLERLTDFLQPRARLVVILGGVATALTLFLTSQMTIENDLVKKFSEDHPVQVAVKVIEEKFGGNGEVELLIDTGEPDGMKDPRVIGGLWELDQWLEAQPTISRVNSLVDLLAELHNVLSPQSDIHTDIPTSKELIAQYLLLFEASGGEDFEYLLDDTGQHGRMSIQTTNMTAEEFIQLAAQIDAKASELLPEKTAAASNGFSLQAARVAPKMLAQSIPALSSTLLLIALLLGVLFKSLKIGILSIIPNILPVAVALLAVGILHDRVDVDALTFLTICICIAVDDTIHFLSRYRLERSRGVAREEAVKLTILEAGLGIIRTSIILTLGFGVLLSADYSGTNLMGLMLSVSLVFAVILDLTLLPAMATLGFFDPDEAETHPAPHPPQA